MDEEKTRLIDLTNNILQNSGYREKTRKFYLDWIYRFLFYFGENTPTSFGNEEIDEFVNFLESDCQVAPSTIKQAETAIHFFYREILNSRLNFHRKSSLKNEQLPVILTRKEVKNVLRQLTDDKWLITGLMYGCGLKLNETLQLRVRDINLTNQKISICDSYGNSSRILNFPKMLAAKMKIQLKKVRAQHKENIADKSFIGAMLPDFRKIKNHWPPTSTELEWQYLFPSKTCSYFKNTEKLIQQPVSESYVQKSLKEVFAAVGICDLVSAHSFRHSFATHLIESGYDIHLVQKILGHKCIQSTAVYKKLANPDNPSIITPLDQLFATEKQPLV